MAPEIIESLPDPEFPTIKYNVPGNFFFVKFHFMKVIIINKKNG
jgi:hypothetical protein